jgi:tetratricopeptide (TPR) repeat protein
MALTRQGAYRLAFGLGAGAFGASLLGATAYTLARGGALPGLPPGALTAYERHLAQGELRQAAREHRVAARIDPTSFGNAPGLFQALREAGDVEGELEQYRLARARWPRDPAVHRALGQALCRLGRLDEGLAALAEAL